MGSAAVVLCTAAAAFCADGPSPAFAQQPAPAPPAQVMTDTPEYCVTLRDKLDQMESSRPVLEEVRSLEIEGRRLCDAGETRGGILRLRHALMLMMRASREPNGGD
jgi:hypothetical protein